MDKVLDAFRNCITEPKCKDCPWEACEEFGNKKVSIPVDLALAVDRMLVEMLKKQEPRLLKPEEFAGTYNYCWLETKASDGRTSCVISDICVGDDGVNYEAQFLGTFFRGHLPHDLLGSRWRCWSAEPTEEQREAVKWE